MLSQFFPPLIGGEERHVANLSAELVAREHSVAVATVWQPGLPEFEMMHGVRVYRVRGTVQRASWLFQTERTHAPPLPDPELAWSLGRIALQEQAEIVHAHNWIVHSFLPVKAAAGAKLVLSLHDFSMVCATKKLLYKDAPCSGPGLRKCLDCSGEHYGAAKGAITTFANWGMNVPEQAGVDMFLPVSESTAKGNRLASRGLPVEVIPNFVPDDVAKPRAGMEHYLQQLPTGDFLLFVGAFASYKGVDVLLEAYAGLMNAPPLVMLGYETSEYPIKTTKFPPNVVILKDWPHDAVMEAWRRCAVALVPSTCAEASPTVVIEAMAMGKPVIGSRLGGIVDQIVDGETGLLVQPGDVKELRQAMRILVDNISLRGRLGEAALRAVHSFFASSVVPQYERVYERLIYGKTTTVLNPVSAVSGA